MVKKICIALSIFALLPLHMASATNDRELIELENRLDRETDQLLGRARGNEGAEFVLGVIGAIGELASRNERNRGRRGWHPGYGRHHRKIVCVAANARGQRFRAEGYVQNRAARRALRTCRHFSRNRFDRRLPRTCRVFHCHRSRW